VLSGGGYGFLHGHIHMLTLARGQSVVEGDEDANESTVGGGVESLQSPEFVGRGVGPSGGIHVAAHGEADQVVALVVAVRAGLPKGR